MGAKDSLVGRLLGNAEKFSAEQVAQTIDLLIKHGVTRNATDIHLEPFEQYILVRYRIDGTLHGIHKLPRGALGAVLRKLKNRAMLDTAETRLPQEGQFTAEVGDRRLQVLVTTLPVLGGEKVVLHLALSPSAPLSLETLGFWGQGLQDIQTALARPHGLVVVTGPRHAGIASTLYALLNLVNVPTLNISTVEDPIKQKLAGVNQTLAFPHVSGGFSQGLQAVLRQDPNIIMLSNMPDRSTAELAVHTAVTGHLLLAGFLADNSIQAVLRLHALGIEPFLLTSAFRAAIGQRLVRRLCKSCRERYEISGSEVEQIEAKFGISTSAARKRVHELEQLAIEAGVGADRRPGSTSSHMTHLWRKSKDGCEACHHSGYMGRTAIVEVLPTGEALQKQLLGRPERSRLQATALKEGFVPMALDGLIKALRGETTIAEVLRVVEV